MRIHGSGVVVLAVLLLGAAGPVSGEGDPEAGASSYRVYCGACHGAVDPGARELPGDDLDLTRLEERYGAPLAKTRLLEHIGRRDPAAASFERDMSVCGTLLMRDLEPTAGLRAGRRGTALAILQYLERVQRAPEAATVAIRGRTR